MDINNIGASSNASVYDAAGGYHEYKNVLPDKLQSQDSYVHSSEEPYYAAYTSNGVISGEESSGLEDEKSCILPERYNGWKSCYIYYQGNRISEYELIQTAVKTGAITLDESETAGWNLRNAMDALIDSKATPLYDWSTTLYSEDRMYVFRVENGVITGARRTRFSDGTTFQDIANAVASGKGIAEEDRWKLDELRMYDGELYNAAVNIGRSKNCYDTFTEMYQNGQLTEKQFRHDCYPLLLLLFGEDADINSRKQFLQLSDFYEQDEEEFLKNAFASYNPSNQSLADELLIKKNYHSYSGVY